MIVHNVRLGLCLHVGMQEQEKPSVPCCVISSTGLPAQLQLQKLSFPPFASAEEAALAKHFTSGPGQTSLFSYSFATMTWLPDYRDSQLALARARRAAVRAGA